MSLKLVSRWTRSLLLVACAGLVSAHAEDIDLFLKNPSTTGVRPNVLLIIDNAASNNSVIGQLPNPTGSKKLDMLHDVLDVLLNPLTSNHFPPFPSCVVSGTTRTPEGCLTETETRQAFLDRIKNVNLGLMIMNPSGAAKGGYVRYHVRPMNVDSNRAALWSLIDNAGTGIPQANNAPYAKSMHEAYMYFGGKPAYAGFDSSSPYDPAAKSGNRYVSPIGDECQINFIIFIGNGGPDSGEESDSKTLLNGLGGILNSDPLSFLPTNYMSSWFDEYARTLNVQDLSSSYIGVQNATTYTIAIQSPADNNFNTAPMTSARSLLQSAASAGGGEYALGQDGASALKALDNALQQMQPVNSVFAAVTLPVSVNVRGTFLNQVYMGQFRPDKNALPRWPGNLKQYQIGLSNGNPVLEDRAKNPVEDVNSGFLLSTATSFWTVNSSYWGFVTPAIAASDAPDGSSVEKGGVGQRLRKDLATSALQATRKLYTCAMDCSGLLSSQTFTDGNKNITASALGINTGSSATDATQRTALINWVRGADNKEDENKNTDYTDARAYIHGDLLHSRPAVVNYNRTAGDRDVVVYYGANDGIFRAVKGGQDDADGWEKWGIIFPEFFSKLKRLRDNDTVIDSSNPKPYFADGPVSVYQNDVNKDGKLVASDGDKVYLYIGMRRGGRVAYALDVSDPDNPKYLWKFDRNSSSELGQTWSTLRPTRIKAVTDAPVVVFGAGYDRASEDAVPAQTNTRGRGIFVLNGVTGELKALIAPAGMGSVTADLTVLDRDGDGYADRIYAPDTKGNVWRVDIDDANPDNWKSYKIASLGGTGSDARKFLNKIDVVYATSGQPYDALLVGSGDREHPLDASIVDRFYMLMDTNIGLAGGLICGDAAAPVTCTHGDLTDVTSNAYQTGDLPAGTHGWYLTFGAGEKLVDSPMTVFGTVIFGTNQPVSKAPGVCSNLGKARLYQIGMKAGNAVVDLNADGVMDGSDRSMGLNGGGFPPSPVYTPVTLDGKRQDVVCVGTHCFRPGGSKFDSSRYRTYWYTKQ